MMRSPWTSSRRPPSLTPPSSFCCSVTCRSREGWVETQREGRDGGKGWTETSEGRRIWERRGRRRKGGCSWGRRRRRRRRRRKGEVGTIFFVRQRWQGMSHIWNIMNCWLMPFFCSNPSHCAVSSCRIDLQRKYIEVPLSHCQAPCSACEITRLWGGSSAKVSYLTVTTTQYS